MNSDIPKVFHQIGNIPMIIHVILTAILLNPTKIILVVSPDILDEMKSVIAKYVQIHHKDCRIVLIVQEIPDGTASAALVAINRLQEEKCENILIMCADAPLIKQNSLQMILELLKISKSKLVLLAFESEINSGYGRVVFDSNRNIKKIVEFCDEQEERSGIHLFNSGVMAGKYSQLAYLLRKVKNNNTKKEYYLTDIIQIASDADIFIKYVITEKSEVIGINSREDLAHAERIFQKQMLHKHLLAGVTLLDQKSVFFSYGVTIGRDSIIHPYVFFGPNALIRQRVTIYPFSHLSDCEIQDGSLIGPFASISGNSFISNNVHVGNFVELKRSSLQNNVKIKHLSYVGDTQIDEYSNIGAGAVFCNYDGKQKHRTKVGKRCLIGANNSIIAPLEIGDDVKTGAGSVIYKDILDGHIAISRAEQVNKKRK